MYCITSALEVLDRCNRFAAENGADLFGSPERDLAISSTLDLRAAARGGRASGDELLVHAGTALQAQRQWLLDADGTPEEIGALLTQVAAALEAVTSAAVRSSAFIDIMAGVYA